MRRRVPHRIGRARRPRPVAGPGGGGRLRPRQRVAAAVLAVLAACFITLDLGGAGLSSAHDGVRGTLGALYRGTDAVLGPVRRFVQAVPHAGADDRRIRALEQRTAQLRKQLADSRVDRRTAARLRQLQLAATRDGHGILPAQVIAMTPAQGFDWTVTVDVGVRAGVRVGQTVTDGDGLVGRVLRADPSSAVVLLAVDPGSGAGARDQRSGELGVATGRGGTGYTFRPLDPTASIRVGDELRTGPAGHSSFAAGLAVGRVATVRHSADGTTVATVTPAVSAGSLDLVGVILPAGDARTATAERAPLTPAGGSGGRR